MFSPKPLMAYLSLNNAYFKVPFTYIIKNMIKFSIQMV